METGVHVRTATFIIAAAVTFAPIAAWADEKADCVSASEKAQQLKDDRKLIKAREQFLVCARDVCPAAVKKDCADQVADLEKRSPTVVIRAKDKAGQDLVAVKVTADGAPLTEQLDGHSIPLDPGVHTFRFETAGADPIEQKVVLAEGEKDRGISANFGGGGAGGDVTPVKKKGAPIGAFIVGGIGVVAMGVGAAFWGIGIGQKGTDEGPGGCAPTPSAGGAGCSTSEINDIHTKLVIGDVMFFAGTAVLVGGVIWTIVHYAGGGGSKESALLDIASGTIRW
jgi:hypothetical protein